MIPRPSFYTLEDLMEPRERGGWGLTLDALRVLAEDGQIQLSLKTICGESREGITAEERGRVEGQTSDAAINRRRESTLLQLIGALAVAYSGGSAEMTEHPYTLLADLESCAAANGCALPCGQQTAAEALGAGIAMLKERGLYRPKAPAAAEPQAKGERQAA